MMSEVFSGLSFLIGLLCAYMLPTIIACIRKKRNSGAIGAFNFLLGWTCIGWVGAFVWSLMQD